MYQYDTLYIVVGIQRAEVSMFTQHLSLKGLYYFLAQRGTANSYIYICAESCSKRCFFKSTSLWYLIYSLIIFQLFAQSFKRNLHILEIPNTGLVYLFSLCNLRLPIVSNNMSFLFVVVLIIKFINRLRFPKSHLIGNRDSYWMFRYKMNRQNE